MDELRALQSLGLELPGASYIVDAIAFGLIGLFAYRSRRKHKRRTRLWLGVALMLYRYAVSQTWLLYALGVALCGGIFFDPERRTP